MKKYLSITMLLIFGLVMLSSCDKETGVVTPISTEDAVSEMMISYSVVACETTEPDMQTEISVKPMSELGKHLQLNSIFKKLKLTADQKSQAKIFLEQQRECTELAMKALRLSEKEIIQNANVERKAIMQQLKDSTISKDSARILLKALGESTRLAIKNNPAREAAELAMKECRETFIENMNGILTDEQLIIWQQFLDKNKPTV